MSQSKLGDVWFQRDRLAPELEGHVVNTKNAKRVFFDEDGRDRRFQMPGLRWGAIREKRKEVVAEYTKRIESIFEEVYAKITGERRESFGGALLPAIKTPAISKTRSRITKKSSPAMTPPAPLDLDDDYQGQPDDYMHSLITPEKVPNKRVTRARARQSDTQASPSQSNTAPSEADSATEVVPLDVVMLNVTNTSSAGRGTRRQSRKAKLSLNDGQDNGRVTRGSVRGYEEGENSETIPKGQSMTASKRRSRRKVAGSKVVSNTDFEPRTTRSTRSRTRLASTRPALSTTTEEEGKSSDDVLSNAVNEKVKRVKKISIDVERITPQRLLAVDEKMEVSIQSTSASGCDEEGLTMTKAVGRTQTTGRARKSSRARSSTNIRIIDSDSEGEGTYTRPPPPKRSLLKLKKKKQPARKAANKRNMTKNVSDSQTMAVETAVNASADDNSVKPFDGKYEKNGGSLEDVTNADGMIQDADSHETLYESCVSDVDNNYSSPQPPVGLRSTTFVRTPKSSHFFDPSAPTSGSGKDTHHSSHTPNHARNSPDPKGTYVKALPTLSPMSVPYLTGTPRTIQKLQEEHRTRTKGTLLSLSQLRNRTTPQSGGRRPHTPGGGASKPGHQATPLTLGYGSTPGSDHTPAPLEKMVREKKMANPPERKDSFSNGSTEDNEADTEGTCSSLDDRYGTETEGSQTGLVSDDKSSSNSSDNNSSCEKVVAMKKPNLNMWKMFLSRKAGDEAEVAGLPGTSAAAAAVGGRGSNISTGTSSFLPRNSPTKHDTHQSRQKKLAERILRKRAEEERRKEELAVKKQQDLHEKIRRREERAKRVAEKQAALLKEEASKKKKKVEDVAGRDAQVKLLHQQKAREIEQKNRQRMQAAEARRKQDDQQQKKRLKQLEEERTLNTHLALKRKEMEEEEKRRRKQEKLAQERERQFQREAEREKEREQELKKRQEEEDERKMATEAQRKHLEEKRRLEQIRKDEEQRKFVNLLKGITNTAPSNTQNRIVQQWKQLKTDAGEFFGHVMKGTKQQPQSADAAPLSPPESHVLNATFTKENLSPPSTRDACLEGGNAVVKTTPAGVQVMVTPQNSGPQSKTSYEMTPVEQDPLFSYENYDIEDLSSDDQTDDEDDPRKAIPSWADKDPLYAYMRQQEAKMMSESVDVHSVFPPEQLLKNPDLARIFKHKRKRFYVRSSSAHWDSPLLKKSRME